MNSNSNLEINQGEIIEHIKDCLVIGTGTSSEPVISHLSKTNLKTLVIDSSNLYKDFVAVNKRKKFISIINPKQIFSNLNLN